MRPTADFMPWWLEANTRFADCQSPNELFGETDQLIRALGFERFAWGRRHAVPFSQTGLHFSGSYPSEWTSAHLQCPAPGLSFWDADGDAIGSLGAFGYASGATFSHRAVDGSWRVLCVARRKGPIKPHEAVPLKLQLRSLVELLDEHLERVEGAPCTVQLSAREVEVLRWIADGKCSQDIAGILELSEHTVNFHIKSILRKFGSSNRVRAAAQAAALGLI